MEKEYDEFIRELVEKEEFDGRDKAIISLLKKCRSQEENESILRGVIELYKRENEFYKNIIKDLIKLLPEEKRNKIKNVYSSYFKEV